MYCRCACSFSVRNCYRFVCEPESFQIENGEYPHKCSPHEVRGWLHTVVVHFGWLSEVLHASSESLLTLSSSSFSFVAVTSVTRACDCAQHYTYPRTNRKSTISHHFTSYRAQATQLKLKRGRCNCAISGKLTGKYFRLTSAEPRRDANTLEHTTHSVCDCDIGMFSLYVVRKWMGELTGIRPEFEIIGLLSNSLPSTTTQILMHCLYIFHNCKQYNILLNKYYILSKLQHIYVLYRGIAELYASFRY